MNNAMILRRLLKIALQTLWSGCLLAASLGHAGFGAHWFLVAEYLAVVSVPVGLWFLKADAEAAM